MTIQLPEIVSTADATCTVWRDAPSWQGRRTAAIGRFCCGSAEAGAALLSGLRVQLMAEGFGAVIGPMDGDTWHSYRVVSESDGSAPYFLEPVSGQHDFAAFTVAGFKAISSYVSARAEIGDTIGGLAPAVDGVTVRAWDGSDASGLIGQLFELSKHAFANNAFYKPIAREEFLKLYQPILPAIDPRLVLFAYRADGRLAGYLFAIPDRLQGAKPATAIIKTYASALRGVGHLLVDTAHRTMRDLGYHDVVHALMHVDNQSRDRSTRHHGRIFRRYALMGLELV
jgi:hypothetical protein